MIRSDLRGWKDHLAGDTPFVVGDLDPKKTFVHVLDDTSLRILMHTLDTISDFVAYLSRKERLLRGPIRVMSVGEEELLSVYLKNIGSDGSMISSCRVAIMQLVLKRECGKSSRGTLSGSLRWMQIG
jgi:hypothetical protein